MSRYSLHDCGVGTLRYQWLKRLCCDLVEVWERYRTAKRQTQIIDDLKSKKKLIHLNPGQFQLMKHVEVVHLYQFVASTKNLEEICGIGLLASFFMALGFSAYEVGLAFLDLADSEAMVPWLPKTFLCVRFLYLPSFKRAVNSQQAFRLHH